MFIHSGKLFSQIDGVAMGNPLGLTLANWFLGMIEKKIFDQHLSFYPSFYVRYVDDVFAIFNSSTEVQLFLNVLKNQHLNFRFTCEEALDPFTTISSCRTNDIQGINKVFKQLKNLLMLQLTLKMSETFKWSSFYLKH